MDYIEQHNDNAKAFVWAAKAEEILAKGAHACDTLTPCCAKKLSIKDILIVDIVLVS